MRKRRSSMPEPRGDKTLSPREEDSSTKKKNHHEEQEAALGGKAAEQPPQQEEDDAVVATFGQATTPRDAEGGHLVNSWSFTSEDTDSDSSDSDDQENGSSSSSGSSRAVVPDQKKRRKQTKTKTKKRSATMTVVSPKEKRDAATSTSSATPPTTTTATTAPTTSTRRIFIVFNALSGTADRKGMLKYLDKYFRQQQPLPPLNNTNKTRSNTKSNTKDHKNKETEEEKERRESNKEKERDEKEENNHKHKRHTIGKKKGQKEEQTAEAQISNGGGGGSSSSEEKDENNKHKEKEEKTKENESKQPNNTPRGSEKTQTTGEQSTEIEESNNNNEKKNNSCHSSTTTKEPKKRRTFSKKTGTISSTSSAPSSASSSPTLSPLPTPPSWQWDIHDIQKGDDVPNIVRTALESRRYDYLFAAGGDGTVSWIIDGLAVSDVQVPLGIIPYGTGNAIAQEMGIPRNAKKAIRLLAGGTLKEREVDLIRVGDKYFVLHVDIGLGAITVQQAQRRAKRMFGVSAYVWTAFKGLFGYQPRTFRLTIDGNEHIVNASEIVLANSSSLGIGPGYTWGPGIKPDDGVLDVCVFKLSSVWEYGHMMMDLLWKKPWHNHNVYYLKAKKTVDIDVVLPTEEEEEAAVAEGKEEGEKEQPKQAKAKEEEKGEAKEHDLNNMESIPVQGDGDLFGQTPMHAEVVHNAVTILCVHTDGGYRRRRTLLHPLRKDGPPKPETQDDESINYNSKGEKAAAATAEEEEEDPKK
ncbi:Diacylglycerol kinase [Balamuthia mandrillaris]